MALRNEAIALYFKSEPFQRRCLAILLEDFRWLRARTGLTFEGSRFCNNVVLGVSQPMTCDLMLFNASLPTPYLDLVRLLMVWPRARRGGMLYRYNKLFLHYDTAFSLPK